ncbi:single-stranded DNA-binding protein [Flavicella marina]|uniref:single-stranded DNA-binding protein n=1 Tax=Flavicella marina TaxID=1475951 RepID=UPI001264AFEC|nr:single-stranded DNA-binding protein [Flavicella marina]
MNSLRNKVQLIGHVGIQPEMMTLESGKKFVKFTMATNDSFKNSKGEKIEETQWHNLVVWNALSNVVENYVNKGDEIAIEGRLTNRSYQDKEGNKRYISEIVVNELLLLGNKK